MFGFDDGDEDPGPDFVDHICEWLYPKLPLRVQRFVDRFIRKDIALSLSMLFLLFGLPHLFTGSWRVITDGPNGIYRIDSRYKQIGIPPPGKNPWKTLSLEDRRRSSESFTAFEPIPNDPRNCIDRIRYRFEFSRHLGLMPYEQKLQTPHVFVIGDRTTVGESLLRVLDSRKVETVHVGCESSFDFSSPDASIILQTVNITHAYVTCPMEVPARSTTNGTAYLIRKHAKYLSGVFANLQSQKIPFTYVIDGILDDEHARLIAQYGGNVYVAPRLLSPMNKIALASRECELHGKVIIELDEDDRTSDLSADQVSDYLLRERRSDELEQIEIESQYTEDTETLIRRACQFCNVTFVRVSRNRLSQNVVRNMVTIEGKPNAIDDFLHTETFVIRKKGKPGGPFLSIVVAGDDEDFVPAAFYHFLKAVDFGLAKAPCADIELIFVEYNVTESVHDKITVSPLLKGKVRFFALTDFDVLSVRQHQELPGERYLGSMARNAGIRRALGQYILSTTINTLLPSTFFELIAKRDLSEGILYQAKQYDIEVRDAHLDHLLDVMHEKWRFREVNATKHCLKFNRRFLVSDSIDKFMANYEDCGLENFVLMSKRLWKTIAGFDEGGDYFEMYAVFLSKIMRLVPGYVRQFISPIVLYNTNTTLREFPPADVNTTKVMEDNACDGESEDAVAYQHDNWGAHSCYLQERRL
jgi:hypothetical protein